MLQEQKQALNDSIVGIKPIVQPVCEDVQPFVAISFPPRMRDAVTAGVAKFVNAKCNKATAHHLAEGRICVTVVLKIRRPTDPEAFAEVAEEGLEDL